MEFCCGKIKVVEGKNAKKNIYINKSFTIDIPMDIYDDGIIYDMEQLLYLIGNSLKQYDISTKKAIAVINSSKIITREITMPKVSHEEIKSILQYQVRDYIPIEPEEYIVQYLVSDLFLENGVERLKLLLVSIPKEIVESHLNLLKNMDLCPEVLDFQGNAIAKLIDFNERINDEYFIGNDTIASIDLGYDITKLTIIQNGKIKISRVLEIGLFHIIDRVSNTLNLSKKEVEKHLFNGFKAKEDIEMESEKSIMNKIIKNNFLEILEDIEIVFRYHLNRDVSNSIDLILLQGEFMNIEEVREFFIDFFNISSIQLQTLENIKINGKLSDYANAVGSIIRKNEVIL